jgi:drug/metabolite transporter (DMT)-like permease
MQRSVANVGLLLAAAIWGGGFIAQSQGMSYLGLGWLTCLRFIFAFAVVAPLGIVEAKRAQSSFDFAQFYRSGIIPLGLAFTAATLLQQKAFETTSVTHVGFLAGLYVVFVPCIETLALRRIPHPLIWLAALLALCGTWLLGGGFGSLKPGDFLSIGAASIFAVQIILMERFVQRTARPIAAALFQSGCATVAGGVLGLLSGPIAWNTIVKTTPELLYAGIFSGGIAFVLQAVCQRFTSATEAAVMLMAESLFAALFAWLLLNERLPPFGWTGCALIFSSLIIAQVGPMLFDKQKVEAGRT